MVYEFLCMINIAIVFSQHPWIAFVMMWPLKICPKKSPFFSNQYVLHPSSGIHGKTQTCVLHNCVEVDMNKFIWFQSYVTQCELGNIYIYILCAALCEHLECFSGSLSLCHIECKSLCVVSGFPCAVCTSISGSPTLCRIDCKSLCVLLGCPGSPPMPCISFSSSRSSLVSIYFFFEWLLMLL